MLCRLQQEPLLRYAATHVLLKPKTIFCDATNLFSSGGFFMKMGLFPIHIKCQRGKTPSEMINQVKKPVFKNVMSIVPNFPNIKCIIHFDLSAMNTLDSRHTIMTLNNVGPRQLEFDREVLESIEKQKHNP